MKILFILTIGIFTNLITRSQIVTVLDKENGQPIEMATVASENPSVIVTTNAEGQADFSAFASATEIYFRMLGYKGEVFSFEQVASNKFVVMLTSLGISMDKLVVSATRWSQRSGDIPSKITSISAKDVALQNPQTAADLLGVSGEVFIQKSQQGGGSPMIRGFSTNRLLYTVDGVRMNTAIFRSGNLQNVISLDPFAIEETEIFFGPGTVVYGSDAIGGVMSFQTLSPRLSLRDDKLVTGKAEMRYSSANQEKTAHFDVNVGWKKWAMVTSFSTFDYGDLRMGSNGPDEYLRPFYVQRIDSLDVVVTNDDPRVQRPSGYSQINMMQKIRFAPSAKWDFQYGFHYSETSEYSRYDRHIRYKDGLPRYGEWSYGPQKWMMNNLSISHNGRKKLYDQMTLRLAWQNFEESRFDRNINDNERHIRIEKVDAYSANLDLFKIFSPRNKLYYGAEVVTNDVVSIGIDQDIALGASVEAPARYPNSTWNSVAAYVSNQFKLSKKFLLQSGLRFSSYMLESKFDTTSYPFPFELVKMNSSALTGSVGLVYRPTDKWVISLNGSTGFRAPNVDDSGKVFDSVDGTVSIPNPDLKAEYAYNAEVDIAKVFDDVVKVDVAAYYTILTEAMVRRNFTLNGEDSLMYNGELSQIQAIQNAAQTTVYGIQAGFEMKLISGFGFGSQFNYQVGEEELDDGSTSPSRHAPPWFGISKLNFNTGKLNFQLNVVYSGERLFDDLPFEEQGKKEIYAVDPDGNPWSPGWYTINFKAMSQMTDHLSVSAGIENISDQRYRPYSSGIVAPGRNVVLSARVVF